MKVKSVDDWFANRSDVISLFAIHLVHSWPSSSETEYFSNTSHLFVSVMHLKHFRLLMLYALLWQQSVIARAGDECELRRVMHEFQLPGCVRKLVPSYGCQGSCSSYVQVSSSKFWELERSCTCCQDMGQKERTVTVECPGRPIKEMRVR